MGGRMKLLEKIWQGFSYAVWWVCHEWLFDLAWFVGRILAYWNSNWKIYGAEKIPRNGGLLITANHMSQWDLVFMNNLVPRPPFYVTKREYLDFFFVGGMALLMGSFPINRGKYDRQALRRAIELLKKGQVVVIFPEGTRSKTFALQEGHSGAALIAAQAATWIVPVAFSGTEKISRKKEYGPDGKKRKPNVIVRIGDPYRLPTDSGPDGRRESLQDLGDLMMSKIAELLPPEYQGEYAPDRLAERKAARAIAQTEQTARRLERKQTDSQTAKVGSKKPIAEG